MRVLIAARIGLVLSCVLWLGGCGSEQAAGPAGGEQAAEDAHEHDHPAEGPHGGHIIELGTEDYHAELTHADDASRVGIYFLGDDAKTAKPIAAESVTINVSVDGQPSQYTLKAVPQEGEADGTSSYFELDSEPLHTVVAGESAAQKTHARLNVTIDGKPYVGLIETDPHDHDHGHGHGQAHDEAGEHGHSHEGDDALVWREELEEHGYKIALGHHGTALHAGDEVEPAVQITRNGQPVSDAKVFNALLGADGQTVIAQEVPTVYEPPTSAEPAHYAQGAVKIPADAERVVLRYRIVLPDGGERQFDVPVDIE